MAPLDISLLKRRGLSILRLSAAEWADLEDTRSLGRRFTSVFSHAVARSGRTRAPVLLVIGGGEVGYRERRVPQLRLGWVKSIQAVATRDSRVAIDHIQRIEPSSLQGLIGSSVPNSFRASAERLVQSRAEFEAASRGLSAWLLERLSDRAANVTAFQRLLALVDRPTQFRNAVALQQDALALALKAFGAPDAAAQELSLPGTSTALAGVRLQEDVVIEHDARWLPGWALASSDVTGRAVFTQGDHELQVFTANKQPLEHLFGVDLIYLNETRRSIVMVQYKMMNALPRRRHRIDTDFGTYQNVEEQEWVVPIDAQFESEMQRMEGFDIASPASGPYRMSPSPFFFKLVRRNGQAGGPGILMSLAHLKQLLAEGQFRGPRGGLRIAYSELKGHYLRGETFVDLVRSGYVGSHSATTDHFEALIDATLTGGRAAVAAIQRILPDPRYSDVDPTSGDV